MADRAQQINFAAHARHASVASVQRYVFTMRCAIDRAHEQGGNGQEGPEEIAQIRAELDAMQCTIDRIRADAGGPPQAPPGVIWSMPDLVPTWNYLDAHVNTFFCAQNTNRLLALCRTAGGYPLRMSLFASATVPLTSIPVSGLYSKFGAVINPTAVGVFELLIFIYGEQHVTAEFGAIGSGKRTMFAACVIAAHRGLTGQGAAPVNFDALLILTCYANHVLYRARMAAGVIAHPV